MAEESSIADRLSFVEGERIIAKWQESVKVMGSAGGLFGKKYLVGEKDASLGVPCWIIVTDRRIILCSEYYTQRKIGPWGIGVVPLGRKKNHTLYGDFKIRHLTGMKVNMLGGCRMTFAAHGNLPRQYPKFKDYTLELVSTSKKVAQSLEEGITKLQGIALDIDGAGCLELE